MAEVQSALPFEVSHDCPYKGWEVIARFGNMHDVKTFVRAFRAALEKWL